MITGEGGIGKTRLAGRAGAGRRGLRRALRALRRGRAVPVRTLHRDARRPPGRAARRRAPAVLGEAGADLARMLPELRARAARRCRTALHRIPRSSARGCSRPWTRWSAAWASGTRWCASSTTCTGPTARRCCWASTWCGPRAWAGCCWWAPTATPSSTQRHPLARGACRPGARRADRADRACRGSASDEITRAGRRARPGARRPATAARDPRRDPRQPVLRQAAASPHRGGGQRRGDEASALPAGLREVVVRRVARLPGAGGPGAARAPR